MKVKWLMLVCLLVAALVVVGCAPTKAPRSEVPAGYESIRMVGASLGSSSATEVMAYATLFNRYYPEIEWSSSSGDHATNIIYVTKGTLKLGAGLTGGYVLAYGLDKIPESRLRSVSSPSPTVHYFFFVPEDKPWKNISELPKGSRLVIGGTGVMLPPVEAWLGLAGRSKGDFSVVVMSKTEMADAWRTGKMDVGYTSVSGIAPFLMDMQTSSRKFKPLDMTPEQIARAKAEQTFERHGFDAPAKSNLVKLAPEIFKDEVYCAQQPKFIIARDDFPEDIAYKMAKIIDEHFAELTALYASMKWGTPQWHIQWAKPPLDIHAGVAKYYREKGYLK